MNQPVSEPGSLRDWTSKVFREKDRVLRGLDEAAWEEWLSFKTAALFPELVSEGKLMAAEETPSSSLPPLKSWSGALSQPLLPFVSYPYEWPFDMLKDAASLHLEILGRALPEGFILKDASPYNIQWRGCKPLFIDIPSFVRWRRGEPWGGYLQFCRLFLYPLMLEAYRGVPLQPWLRGRLEGLEPSHCWKLLSWRDILRPGVFAHVYLHQRLQRIFSRYDPDMRPELGEAGFSRNHIQRNITGLARLVQGLRPKTVDSAWSGYDPRSAYGDSGQSRKTAFVSAVLARCRRALVWDLGCNQGFFSRLAAETADFVVALDADPTVVNAFYRRLKAEGQEKILPLIYDLADPSPDLGWSHRERRAFSGRRSPDLILCLGLLHHLVLGDNVPLEELVNWLAKAASELIIEFIPKNDPLAAPLWRGKEACARYYDRPFFEACLSEKFKILRVESLGDGARSLYHAARH